MDYNRAIVFCSPACFDLLIDQLRRILKSRERILVIAPTSYAVEELELNLLEPSGVSAIWGRSVFTFASMAKAILGESYKEPLNHSSQMFVLERAVERVGLDYYRDVARMNGFLGPVRDFIQELKEILIWPEAFSQRVVKPLRDSSEQGFELDVVRLSEIGEVMREYQKIAKELGGDKEDIILEATEMLRKGVKREPLHKLIFFGFSDLSPLQWLIFDSVIKAFEPSETLFMMPFSKKLVMSSDVLGFEAARETVAKLKKLGFSELEFEESKSGFDAFASALLTGSVLEKVDVDVEMLEFFDEREEIDGVLKQWRLEAQKFGPRRAVVLHRKAHDFSANFWLSFWHDAKNLDDHWNPQIVRNIAPLLLVELIGALHKNDSSEFFAAIKELATLDKFFDIWQEEVNLLWRGDSIDVKEILSKCPISDDLKRFILSLMEGPRRPSEWLNVMRDFACRLSVARLIKIAPSQIGVLSDFINEMSILNERGLFGDSEISLGEWHRLCVKTLDLMQTSCGGFLFDPVRSPFEIRGGTTDCAIICGLNLRDFPNQPQENVFLGDGARRYLFLRGGLRLRTTNEIYGEEWPLFYQVAAAAKNKLVMTRCKYIKRDVEMIPSPFWECARIALGRGDLPRRVGAEIRGQVCKEWFDEGKMASMGNSSASLLRAWLKVESVDYKRVGDKEPQIWRAMVTSMDDLLRCPYLLFAIRILGLSSREDRALDVRWRREVGTIMHDAFERMLKFDELSEKEVGAILKKVVAERESKLRVKFSDEQLGELERWAVKQVAVFQDFQLFRRALDLRRLSVECEEEVVYEVGRLKFNLQGRPDLVAISEQGVIVIDFKTSKTPWIRDSMRRIERRQVDEKTSIQLPLYAQVKYGEGALKAIAILSLRESSLYILATEDFERALREKLVDKYEKLKSFVVMFKSKDNLESFLKDLLDGSLRQRLESLILGRIERSPIRDSLCKSCVSKDFCRAPLL